MKIKRGMLGFMAVLLIGLLAACGQSGTTKHHNKQQATKPTVAVKPYLATTTPTFYVHGFQGSAKSTNTLIKHAEQQVDAKKVIVATVSPNGTVSYTGH